MKKYFLHLLRQKFAVLLITLLSGPVSAQVVLDPLTHPQFVNPLPIPAVVDATAERMIMLIIQAQKKSKRGFQAAKYYWSSLKVFIFNYPFPEEPFLFKLPVSARIEIPVLSADFKKISLII